MPIIQQWGRKESFIWPPRGYLYTLGAFFLAIVVSGFFVYLRFQFGLLPLQRYYLPYYLRSHSAQGLTAERLLIHADTGVHPELLNSRFGYVSVSRASHEATLFTDDLTKLSPQLSVEVSKSSALEINQTASMFQEIGMG